MPSSAATRADPPAAVACPGCGARLPPVDAPAHPYIGASTGCWALYGRVLERAYADPVCRDVLQLVVDAYACQHPGEPGRRSAQSVGIHLMTLCMVLEDGADPRDGPRLHKRMVARPAFAWLEPPAHRGAAAAHALAESPTPAAYVDGAWAFARDVWRAWAPHHATVRGWIAPSLG